MPGAFRELKSCLAHRSVEQKICARKRRRRNLQGLISHRLAQNQKQMSKPKSSKVSSPRGNQQKKISI